MITEISFNIYMHSILKIWYFAMYIHFDTAEKPDNVLDVLVYFSTRSHIKQINNSKEHVSIC